MPSHDARPVRLLQFLCPRAANSRRAPIVAAILLTLLPFAESASAHSFGQVYTLPVPFWLYAWAAAATLILSFLIVGVFLTAPGGKSSSGGAAWQEKVYAHRLPDAAVTLLQVASLSSLALCIAAGLLGTPSPYGNFNMTFFWVVFVLGFTYLTALCGDLYALINPWRLLCGWIALRVPAYARGRIRYPTRAAYWPALVLYAAFIWAELFGGSDPHALAWMLIAYTALNLLAVWLIGEAAWFGHGEIFSVLLRQIARLAPIEFPESEGKPSAKFRWRWPCSGLLERSAEHPTLVLFVLFMLAATAFDGLHETRPWVRLFWTTLYRDLLSGWLGRNPIAAFPTLMTIYPWWQSAWLLAFPLLYLVAYLAAVELMRRIAGGQQPLWPLAQRFAHTLLPIVLVYNITHYYTLIQTQGVKIIALASDPFGHGWNLFGTAEWFRGTIVPDTTVVWHVQVALILLGHIASVVLAHLEALRIFPDRRTVSLSQLPMLGLMVLFTVFGLWILSLPLDSGGYRR